jgi:hypothetical protein
MAVSLLHMRNFEQYRPENAEPNLMYLRDDRGRDWYQWRNLLKPSTMKVLYGPEGDVACIVRDLKEAVLMNPLDLSLVEMPCNPKYLDPNKKWKYIDGKLIPHEHQF